MTYSTSKNRYLEAEVLGRSREWLIPLMYEHLLSHLRRAVVQIEAGDVEGRSVSLEKATAIVLELTGGLDFAQGGEIASRLSALYAFFTSEIMTVGRTLDVVKLQKLIDIIAGLHEAWTGAAEAVSPRTRPGGTAGGGSQLA